MEGYDIDLVKQVSESVNIPVIALGGAKDKYDFKKVLEEGGAHAAAASSMFVYYGKQKAVLINVLSEEELISLKLYKI
jgi:cyclase